MPKKEISKIIDNNTLYFECIDEGFGYLDTKVTINGTLFCWISFSEFENFVNDFSQFMSKYRI